MAPGNVGSLSEAGGAGNCRETAPGVVKGS